MARLSRYHTRQLSAASNHLRLSISSVYDESTTGVNVRTGKPNVSKVASRINAKNRKHLGLHTKWGQLDLDLR